MIRIIEHLDKEMIFNLVDENRAYLKKWLSWVDNNKAEEDTGNFIKFSLHNYAEEKVYPYVIIDKNSIVGLIDLHNINKNLKSACIGYWLAEKYQGKGYVTNAVIELLKIGFDKLNLNKIEIRVAEENRRSRNIPEKLGFKNTAVLRDAEILHGNYISHIIYSLLKNEFQLKFIFRNQYCNQSFCCFINDIFYYRSYNYSVINVIKLSEYKVAIFLLASKSSGLSSRERLST